MSPNSGPVSPLDSDFRLAGVLAERKDKEGGYAALARAIDESNAAGPKRDSDEGARKFKFDRRKLKSIIEADDNLVLSLKELRALDRYLERYGEGLAYVPLFQKPDLMQTLADSGHVTFLLGSKPERKLRHFSHWDVLAMAELQRGINASEVSVRFDIQDVPLHEDVSDARDSIEKGQWMELLKDQGPSLVCLGSSRTIPAAEAMLCRMFGCPTFEEASPDEKGRLPFHFVWDPELEYIFPSHFHLGRDDLTSRDLEAVGLIKEGDASAVVASGDVLVDRVFQRRWGDTYGVCVAQRRKRGQVWLVLAGITGAATFVAAKLAKNLATRLHEQERGRDSDVYWAVIRAHVPNDESRPLINLRQFAEETIVSGPHVWRPESR